MSTPLIIVRCALHTGTASQVRVARRKFDAVPALITRRINKYTSLEYRTYDKHTSVDRSIQRRQRADSSLSVRAVRCWSPLTRSICDVASGASPRMKPGPSPSTKPGCGSSRCCRVTRHRPTDVAAVHARTLWCISIDGDGARARTAACQCSHSICVLFQVSPDAGRRGSRAARSVRGARYARHTRPRFEGAGRRRTFLAADGDDAAAADAAAAAAFGVTAMSRSNALPSTRGISHRSTRVFRRDPRGQADGWVARARAHMTRFRAHARTCLNRRMRAPRLDSSSAGLARTEYRKQDVCLMVRRKWPAAGLRRAPFAEAPHQGTRLNMRRAWSHPQD